MQHKSLFAALLCGALCLTACLKNEESPSVTQVRNAKAHELESIAELNKAQATATITLANADAKLKEAEAKLTEANAKIADAQAKKVEAETALLVVEAKLQEVYVEIAKVDLDIKKAELQAKLAELEALKAQYKAEIAAAEAAEAYWNGVKEQVATELEIEAAQLQAALAAAKAEQAAAEAAYNAILDQIDEQLAEEAREDLKALRDRIEALSTEYTEASMDLIEKKWDLYEANMLKGQLEAGILSLQDYKNLVTEKNNNEIARIQKYMEYLETYRKMSVEEIKDASVDATIAYKQAYDEWFAADAQATALKTAWHELKTQVGYTYENKFEQEGVVLYENNATKYTLPAIADMMGAQVVPDEETGAKKHVYKYEEIIDEETGETEEKEVVLYTEHITKKTPFTYPELPEGIDHVSPRIMETMSDEERVIYPLTVNKDAYQTIVDQQVAATELSRDNKVEKLQKKIDARQEFIDYYAKPVNEYTEALEEAEKLVVSTKEAMEAAYKDWKEAMRVWGQENEIANMLEIQQLVDDYYALYNEAIGYKYDFSYEGLSASELEAKIEELNQKIEWAEAYMNATWEVEEDYDPITNFNPNVPDYSDITYKELLVQLEVAIQRVKDAEGKAEKAQNEFNTVDGEYKALQKNTANKLKDVQDAVDALYEARKALAADPENESKKQDVQNAQDDYDAALVAYNTALGAEGTKKLEWNAKFEALTLANDAVTAAKTVRDAYQSAVDYVKNAATELSVLIQEYQDALDEYDAQIEAYANDLNDMLLEWDSLYDYFMQSESGVTAYGKYDDYSDAKDAYNQAVADRDAIIELYSHKYVPNYYAILYGSFDMFDDYVSIGEMPELPEYPNEDDYNLDDDSYEIDWETWTIIYPEDGYWAYYYAVLDYQDAYEAYEIWLDAYYYDYTQEYSVDEFWYYTNLEDPDDLYIDFGFPESDEYYAENQNYAYYLSVANLVKISKQFKSDIETLNKNIDNTKEKAADQIARFNSIMDLVEDVTATQDVYFKGMEELNKIWADYVVAIKAAFDKKLVMDEAEAYCDALHELLVNTEELDDAIAACETQIAALQKAIADLETLIKTAEDAIEIVVNPAITLAEEEIQVLEALVASLKSELDAALEELNL